MIRWPLALAAAEADACGDDDRRHHTARSEKQMADAVALYYDILEISAPEVDAYYVSQECGDGYDYCRECAWEVVAETRALDPSDTLGDDDIRVVCHSGADTDISPICARCGVNLDLILTDYAVAQELEHFSEGDFNYTASEACSIAQLVQAVAWDPGDPHHVAAIELGHSYLAAYHRHHITRAAVRLHQALDCDRIGIVRTDLLADVAEHLRAAGMPEAVERVNRAVWNDGDLDGLLRELWERCDG